MGGIVRLSRHQVKKRFNMAVVLVHAVRNVSFSVPREGAWPSSETGIGKTAIARVVTGCGPPGDRIGSGPTCLNRSR